MVASDVYPIAMALSAREQKKLYHMLKQNLPEKDTIKAKRKTLPDYTVDDALRYLLDHHM